jgi:hypothetical protein
MKTTKKTNKLKVKLVTKNDAPTPTPRRKGRPRKNVIVSKETTVTNSLLQSSSRTTPISFMEKAKEVTKTAVSKTNKMLYVSGNSLKNNLKWLKANETLNFLPGVQRTLILKHIDRLANSIQMYGMIRPIIVVEVSFINGYMCKYVADGQHALMACMRLGIPIPYVVVNGIENVEQLTELVAMLNSSSRSWKQGDYVNAWAQSKEDYKQLIFLKKKYNLDFDVVITASTGNDGGEAVKTMKAGKFEMPDFAKSELACQRVANLLTIVPKMDRWSTRALTRAAINIFTEETYTNAKHKALMSYVKENADQLRFCASKKEIALEFLRKGL